MSELVVALGLLQLPGVWVGLSLVALVLYFWGNR